MVDKKGDDLLAMVVERRLSQPDALTLAAKMLTAIAKLVQSEGLSRNQFLPFLEALAMVAWDQEEARTERERRWRTNENR